MTKHKRYPKEERDGEIAKLKKQIKKLTKEKEILKSDIKTLERAFGTTIKHVDATLDGIPVEKVIRSAKKKSKLSEVVLENTEKCEKCGTAGMTIANIPHGILHLCKLCNHRKVVKNGQEGQGKDN
jgi:seryl-tRNA synthetase